MAGSDPTRHYSLGYTDAEHDRLVSQASRLALLPNDCSSKQELAAVSVFWTLAQASGTWQCWWPDWLVLREKSSA
jgi:hypothetical protein